MTADARPGPRRSRLAHCDPWQKSPSAAPPSTPSASSPTVGSPAPAYSLTGTNLELVTDADRRGTAIVLNIFPSIDTAVCAASVRAFNQRAAEREGVDVLCVSADLPFAQRRFCGAEGIDRVSTASTFRSTFGTDYGVTIVDGSLAGLLARGGRRHRRRRHGGLHRVGARDRPGARLRRRPGRAVAEPPAVSRGRGSAPSRACGCASPRRCGAGPTTRHQASHPSP